MTIFLSDYGGIAPTEEIAGFDTERRDIQWSIGANVEAPVAENAAIGARIRYTRNDSNLDRFTYDNFQVLFGPVGRF